MVFPRQASATRRSISGEANTQDMECKPAKPGWSPGKKQ